MNGFQSDGICGAAEPDANSGAPTVGDASAVSELLYSVAFGWSPFQPIGQSKSPTEPLVYELAANVDPVGTPAIAEWTPSPEIFVRGSDDRIYTTQQGASASNANGWAAWAPVANGVSSDPAVTFADAGSVYLAVRAKPDDALYLQTRAAGAWSNLVSIGAPAVGAASAPALAAPDANSLRVAVLGGDGLLYLLECSDPQNLCVTTAGKPNAWIASTAPPPGGFLGPPSIVWLGQDQVLMFAAVGQDHVAYVAGYQASGWGPWTAAPYLDLAPNDPTPGVAINALGSISTIGLSGRNSRSILANVGIQVWYPPLGGVLASTPAVVGAQTAYRIDFAALIEDHGKLGVWWKFDDLNYHAPCNYNQPGTCNQCGCNMPGQPHCDQ
jgi:hypothetical protein